MTPEEEQNQRYAESLRRWRNSRIESAEARAEEDEQALGEEAPEGRMGGTEERR